MATANKGRKVPPGEGERTAQRGYVAQYRMAAGLIYDHIAAGRLRWIGVAHRKAGAFDDILLGLSEGTHGVQVKTSLRPGSFRLKTLLLGAEGLWSDVVEGLRLITALEPSKPVSLIYACDNTPSESDQLGTDKGTSSARLLELHSQNADDFSRADWDSTEFAPFLNELQTSANLSDEAFLQAWRNLTFVTGGKGRAPRQSERTALDARRIEDLAALLQRLAADESGNDRWEFEEIMARLGWRDAFRAKHGHRFPLPKLYERNQLGVDLIASAIAEVRQGYVSVLGPPGSGKSTLLAESLLTADRVRTVRYLAYVPGGRTLSRGEAYDFLHDIIVDLKHQGLGESLAVAQSLVELRDQFGLLITEMGQRFTATGLTTVVIVDGLDHIPREQTVERSLLAELPLPDTLPDGVLFLLGSQRLDLPQMPPAVRRQAEAPGRKVLAPPLAREVVVKMARLAGLPVDVDPDLVFERTKGHPLSTRYVIEGIANQPDEAARRAWLDANPSYDGDVDAFYQSIWEAITSDAEVRRTLGYLALADGPLRHGSLDQLTSQQTVDRTWEIAGHLLMVENDSLSPFHNSFRLFLQAKAFERFGRLDPVGRQAAFKRLAAMARSAGPTDPQRWMELRYLARSGSDDEVLSLVTAERFRQQFMDGRQPSEIQDDIGLAFDVAGRTRRADLVLPLLLARQEIDVRAGAISSEIIDAYLALDDRTAARNLAGTDGALIGDDVAYRIVDADLAAGDKASAQSLFEATEPLEELLGLKPLSGWHDEAGLMEWAYRALAFRSAPQFVQMIGKLTEPPGAFRTVDIEALREGLKLEASRGELNRQPQTDPDALRNALKIGEASQGTIWFFAAVASHAVTQSTDAIQRIEHAMCFAEELEDHERHGLSQLAAQLGRFDLAKAALVETPAPALTQTTYRGDDNFADQVDDVLDNAELRERLGLAPKRAEPSHSAILTWAQVRLEDLGALIGRLKASGPRDGDLGVFRQALRDFATHETSDPHDYDRTRLDGALNRIVRRIVDGAVLIDDAAFNTILTDLDEAGDKLWRLRRTDVRRAYGLRAFRHDQDLTGALRRVAYNPGGERTPEAQLGEAAKAAAALTKLGKPGDARALLQTMHREGCGLSQPAKKDPQYIGWIELLERACASDPDAREARVRFMARFLAGLSETEGYDVGGRVFPEVLTQSAQGSSALAMSTTDRAQTLGRLDWSTIVASVGSGVVRRHPSLALVAVTIVGRLAAPFTPEPGNHPFDGLIELVGTDDLQPVANRMLDIIETDTAEQIRLQTLEAVAHAARKRGIETGWDRLARWQSELPLPRSGNSPEDPFFHARSLAEVASIVDPKEETPWNGFRAFARIAPDEGYAAARTFLDAHQAFVRDKRVLKTMGELALAAGEMDEAIKCRDALRTLASDRTSYDRGWAGGASLLGWQLDAEIRGDEARREAFDSLMADMANGQIWPAMLLQYAVDIIAVISPAPTWAEAWSSLEDHLKQFREFALGASLEPTDGEVDESSGIEILADLLYRAILLGPPLLADRSRVAMQEVSDTRFGCAVIAQLTYRLLAGDGEQPLHGAQLAWAFKDVEEVQSLLADRLDELAGHPDYGVRRLGDALRERSGAPKRGRGTGSTPHQGWSPSTSTVNGKSLGETWPLTRALGATAAVTGLDGDVLNRRAAEILSTFNGGDQIDAEEHADWTAASVDVHLPQPRPVVRSAFRALRRLLSELVDCGALSASDAENLVHYGGVDGLPGRDLRVEPRPASLARPAFGELYREEELEGWLTDVGADVGLPKLDGLHVLAGWARHRSFTRSGDFAAEQIFGAKAAPDSFDEAISDLPLMRHRRGVILDNDPGHIALVRRIIGANFWFSEPMVGFCPQMASAFGWRMSSDDPTRFISGSGTLQVRTLNWRDSGCVGRFHGETMLREGQLVVASPDAFAQLSSVVQIPQRVDGWRTIKKDGSVRSSPASSNAP